VGVPNSIRVPVPSEYVFPRGVMVVGVEAATDFDLRGKVEDAQARDKDTGVRVWVLRGVDMDQVAQPDDEPASGFARPAEVKVRIVSAQRPIPPVSRVAGYGALVEFEGLTLTPYTDTSRCTGMKHKCGARQAYSLRATGIREFAGLASTQT
jgi:hypothetical protein